MNRKSYHWYTNGKDNLKVYENTKIPDGFYPGRYKNPMTDEQKYQMIEKSKQTKFERYGDPYYSNTEQARQTCLDRFGVLYPQQNENVRKKSIDTCQEKYGVDSFSKTQEFKESIKNTWNNKSSDELSLIEKSRKKSNQEKYGVDNYFQTQEFQIKSKQTRFDKYGSETYHNIEQVKQTKFERYNDQNYNNREKSKITCIERYGVDNYGATEQHKQFLKDHADEFHQKSLQTIISRYGSYSEYLKLVNEKRNITQLINHSYNTSLLEEDLYNELLKRYSVVQRQYSDERYPYKCDFYIPEYDLFIELNAHWTHGTCIFDQNNDFCKRQLNKWQEKAKISQYYKNAINTWTKLDVKKYQCAKDNNLNYINFYGNQLSELLEYLEDVYTTTE